MLAQEKIGILGKLFTLLVNPMDMPEDKGKYLIYVAAQETGFPAIYDTKLEGLALASTIKAFVTTSVRGRGG